MSKKQTAPSGERESQLGTGAPADEADERAKAMGKKNRRQARAESGAPAERAEGQEGNNDLVAVVGVGASAGGLEAFRQLLKRLPDDTGMAIVLITHLDPRHESILPELLAKATSLPVSEAEDGTRVAPNHVYVMPRNTTMAIEGGALRLWPRDKGRGQHRPIDAFLRTLAEDQNARAIGVILSGTATDGTLGLEAVKAEGGITFAQAPKSAQYDSMPRSAIAAGCVDFVLTPEEIALELARISHHPYVTPAAIAEPGEPGAEEAAQPAVKNGFNKILALLRRMMGVDFTLYKANTLRRRIRRRMILNKLDGLKEYAEYLRNNPEEVENLYQDILINVTSFFRDPEAFEALKEKIFPRIVEHCAPDEPVRIWVVGCSTGEEAYSIAMAFLEFTGERAKHIPVQIFATDLNERSIERARSGFYSKNIVEDVSPERLRRFFTEAEGGYRIGKHLRDMCVFARQNIITDPPFSRMDLISCRNLMIYLEQVLQKQVLPLLHYALKPAGVLWLGHSETTAAAAELFETDDKKNRFYAKKLAPGRPRINYPTGGRDLELEKDIVRRQAMARMGVTVTGGEAEAQREADRIILARYAPVSALIDEEMRVLQLRGDTTPFFEKPPNKATRNLLKLAREGMLVALREAVDKARQGEDPVRKENLRVKFDDETNDVNLEVIPLRRSASQERHFLIIFETVEVADRGGERKAVDRRRKSEERQVRQLNQELAVARDYLQSVIEEYEATNEELQSASEEAQSSNEELQSINEELETSKEELESSNEELITLNEELNNRNTELGRLNSDLANLLGSVQMPILMLDSQLRIRRFTPAAEKLLNLIPTDVGRPIGDLKLNLDCPDLERMIVDVIDAVGVREVETRDGAGRWHLLRVRPYRTLENKIDGAVVVLMDIDALKKIEREIEAERNYAEAILRTTRDPLLVLRDDLTVESANDAFYKTFKVKPAETEGRLIYELGGRQWNIPQLRQLLEEIIPRDSSFNDFEVAHKFPGIGKRSMLLNARRLDSHEGGPSRVLLGVEDVTERREAELALAQLAAIVQSSDDAVVAIDLDGVITSWNQGAEHLYGYAAQEAIGQPIAMLTPPEDIEAEKNILERLLAGEHINHFETLRRRKDGSEVGISLTLSPIRNARGEVIGASRIGRDITERKRVEEATRSAYEQELAARAESEQANRLKDEFLATVSHELRSPLNSILGWSKMLSAKRLDEEDSARALEVIYKSARAQNKLIGELLDVSRIITGKLRLEMSMVDLIPIIEAAVDTVRPAAEAKKIGIISSLDPAAGPVSGDADRLQQVVWNLLSNAVKFTPAGGEVAVRLEREGESVTITVSDNGEGIELEFLPFVFDRFRQFEGGPARPSGGLGLGLAIVRHLVELHGGTVSAASRGKGQGATFRATLPLAVNRKESREIVLDRPSETGEVQQRRVPSPDLLRDLRVLLVDDEPEARELLGLILMDYEAEVRPCASAAEALQALDEWRPDVLVSDIGMPGEDGYELIRKIRAREPERGGLIPALALTAYARVEDALRAIKAGYQAHIPKPVEPAELATAVANLTGPGGND
ncbi:MAG TPA: chemotaxis protein CheB [Blastocatellia bacterium]|jgi:two-component system CheB/CheR fusion protein|nr:chemotaxis protein CheB [Blastocatellia bacterium]